MGQELTPATFQIHGDIAFRLALRASIGERRRPCLRDAVVFELSMSNRRVLTLEDVVQENPVAGVLGDGKAERIRGWCRRHAGTAARVAKVAVIAQSDIIG